GRRALPLPGGVAGGQRDAVGRPRPRARRGGAARGRAARRGATRAAPARYRLPMILASGTTQILLATGAGAFAIVLGGIAVYFTLDGEDRTKLGVLLRHPVRYIFKEDEPEPRDF